MKFLVADDHHLIREGLRYALEGAFNDLLIIEAMDGNQVMNAVDSNGDLDLILLDYFMPGTDGFSLVTTLCERHPLIPIVIVSAADDPSLKQKLLERGAAGFLPKSTDHDAIIEALQLVLAGGIYNPPDVAGFVRGDGSDQGRASTIDGEDNVPVLAQLTQRQHQVLRLMAEGKTNKDISRELFVSENTIKVHVTAILKALNVTNRTQAVLVAQRLWLSDES